MFEKFYKFAGVENQNIINSPESFLKAFSGATFNNGLYRIHTWCIEENVTKAEKGCFGTDKSPVFSVLTNNTRKKCG